MPSATVREVRVTDRETVTIRYSQPADVAGLTALFESLSDRDRHLRFFSPIRPSPALVERWASLAERGGCGLVATVTEDGSERIAGEAGYARLAGGTGEFAITVAPDWRGWLGPLLLSDLLHEAAQRGVTGLAADVLADNRAMLSLIGWRGYAATEHTGDRIRVVLPTTGQVPHWPDTLSSGPRVVIEVPGARWPAAVQAQRSGINVMVCPGPRGRHGAMRCPELQGQQCPLVQQSDAVVVALPADTEAARRDRDSLLLAHRMHRADLPVFVAGETRSPQPQYVRRLSSDLSDEEVVDALQDALGGAQDRTALVRLLDLLKPFLGVFGSAGRGRRARDEGSPTDVGQGQQSPSQPRDGPVV